MNYQTLLVILAHPDDESFPIGGTLAKYAAEGARVVLVSATRAKLSLAGQFRRGTHPRTPQRAAHAA